MPNYVNNKLTKETNLDALDSLDKYCESSDKIIEKNLSNIANINTISQSSNLELSNNLLEKNTIQGATEEENSNKKEKNLELESIGENCSKIGLSAMILKQKNSLLNKANRSIIKNKDTTKVDLINDTNSEKSNQSKNLKFKKIDNRNLQTKEIVSEDYKLNTDTIKLNNNNQTTVQTNNLIKNNSFILGSTNHLNKKNMRFLENDDSNKVERKDKSGSVVRLNRNNKTKIVSKKNFEGVVSIKNFLAKAEISSEEYINLCSPQTDTYKDSNEVDCDPEMKVVTIVKYKLL